MYRAPAALRRHSKLRDMMLTEMIARTLKNTLRCFQRVWMKENQSTSEHGMRELGEVSLFCSLICRRRRLLFCVRLCLGLNELSVRCSLIGPALVQSRRTSYSLSADWPPSARSLRLALRRVWSNSRFAAATRRFYRARVRVCCSLIGRSPLAFSCSSVWSNYRAGLIM